MTSPMISRLAPTAALEKAGFRFGARGTHSARTIMLRDLTELFEASSMQPLRVWSYSRNR